MPLIHLINDIGHEVLGTKWATVGPLVAAWLEANPAKTAALHARILAYAEGAEA